MVQLCAGDMESIKRRAAGKKLICFGTGQVAGEFIAKYGSPMSDFICCFVDNDHAKQGTQIQCGEKNVDIISPEQARALDISRVIFLITTYYYREVVEQLDSIPEFEGAPCFLYIYCIHHTDYKPVTFRLCREMKIPKIIHYFWLGDGEIPDDQKKYMESWKKYCPDYQIICWNEENYDFSQNDYMREAYKCGKWGFVPDFARLEVVYRYGGIYLDTDVELLRSPDDLLYQEAFAGFESCELVNLGSGFGAAPGSDIIRKLMKAYEGRHFVDENGRMDLTVSCILQTQSLEQLGLKRNNQLQRIEGMTIYPNDVLTPVNAVTRLEQITGNSHAIHHFAGSWCPKEQLEKAEEVNRLARVYRDRLVYDMKLE